MSALFTELWSVFTNTITSLAGGIKTAFMNVLYVDPSASTLVVSDFAKFTFVLIGFSLGCSLVYFIVNKIKA